MCSLGAEVYPRIDWLAFLCPVFKTYSSPPSESCPVYLTRPRGPSFSSVNDSPFCHQGRHAPGVGGSGPRVCPGNSDAALWWTFLSVVACVILRVRQHLWVSAPLLHQQRSHVSQDKVLYLDSCFGQHAETCYLRRVHLCVLVEVLRLSRFRSHFSRWLNFRVKADRFWADSPPLAFSFCCCLNQFLLITPHIHVLSLNRIPSPPLATIFWVPRTCG